MRMRSTDKLIMIILLLLLIVLSLGIIAFSFNAFSYPALKGALDAAYMHTWIRVVLTALSLGIIILCVKVLFSRDGVEHSATEPLRVHMTSTGSITISEQAIVQMVREVVMSYPQVNDATVQLAEEDEKLQVRLYIVLASDSVIPEVIADMQSRVVRYVKEHAGLTPGSVAVFVDTAATTAHRNHKESKKEEPPREEESYAYASTIATEEEKQPEEAEPVTEEPQEEPEDVEPEADKAEETEPILMGGVSDDEDTGENDDNY